jgi:hypothetical protein
MMVVRVNTARLNHLIPLVAGNFGVRDEGIVKPARQGGSAGSGEEKVRRLGRY